MVKNIFNILFSLLFILLSVFFYTKKSDNNFWGNYNPLILKSDSEAEKAVKLLNSLGYSDILYRGNATIGINDFFELEEKKISELNLNLDKRDYRYSPYIDSLNSIFSSSDKTDSIIYVKIEKIDLFSLYKIHSVLTDNAIQYCNGNPVFLRVILNYLCFALILLLFGIGCKKRFIITLITGVLAYFFLNPLSLYSYISFVLAYFLIIMITESLSFSNRYIKRNNIGVIRILCSIILFSIPTFLPSFINTNIELYTPEVNNSVGFNYDDLEKLYSSKSPSISNYFTHFAYQNSFLYGYKYEFPKKDNNIVINDFENVEHYLKMKENVITTYNEDFLNKFIEYCSTTEVGKFYLDYGKPFKFRLNSLIFLYIKEKEYMQIGILAVTMFITSLFFKKRGEKKINY